ncbi:hypothetical protein [Acuticoccus sp. I52.16.1]|uniref:hypothetical protein n=1 Tax=Acuticoccus sp. I52.16.1 TaxID=2928472 RepID=UPI001FD53F33|nr:hypothetical protein [Acuticoccus sp. I52.16.1]UOM36274.1 hypothetical protein MRB58_08825 [Acuticoccus sp. I52.16.1]
MPDIISPQRGDFWNAPARSRPPARIVVDADFEPVPRATVPSVRPEVVAVPLAAEVVRPAPPTRPSKTPRAVLKLVEDGIIV